MLRPNVSKFRQSEIGNLRLTVAGQENISMPFDAIRDMLDFSAENPGCPSPPFLPHNSVEYLPFALANR